MTKARARQLLIDAVEDPRLMRELLTSIPARPSQQTLNLLAPYIAGTASQVLSDADE